MTSRYGLAPQATFFDLRQAETLPCGHDRKGKVEANSRGAEAEAQDALGFIVRRQSKRDALDELLQHAPFDDEPTTRDEDQGVREAKEQIGRGEVLSADEIRSRSLERRRLGLLGARRT
jgi:carbonic anhydrase